MTRDARPARSDPATRAGLADLVAGIAPWDDRERDDLASAAAWIASGAPLYRTGKPDIPATHLVSYFVVLDEGRGQMLLVDHRKARLWLPTGGHVEEGEDPWLAVVREAREELTMQAEPSALAGDRPFFLTVTLTPDEVELWEGRPPQKAEAGLQTYVSNLRRLLEPARGPRSAPSILLTRTPGYLLCTDATTVISSARTNSPRSAG